MFYQGPCKALKEPYKALKGPYKALEGPYKTFLSYTTYDQFYKKSEFIKMQKPVLLLIQFFGYSEDVGKAVYWKAGRLGKS